MVEGKNKSTTALRAEVQRLNQRLIILEAAEAKRERIEAELRTEVEFSVNLINALPVFFVALDSSGKPIMMNQVMLNALGYAPHEVLGVDYLSTFISEDDTAKVLSAFEAVTRRQPSPILSEYRMKTKFGQELLVEWHSRPVFRQDQQLDFIFSVGLDVTERRQAEQALKQYAERLKALNEIQRTILVAQAPQRVMDTTLSQLQRLIPYTRASLIELDVESDEAIVATVNRGDRAVDQRLPLAYFGETIRSRQPQIVYVKDIETLEPTTPVDWRLRQEGSRSYLIIPLVIHNQLIGYLNLESSQPAAFTQEHLEIAQEVIPLLAVAIHNARLFEQVQVARNQLERLAHQLVAVQEEERLYISRELHDEAGQALTALKINLTLMQADLTPECETFRQPLGEAAAVIDATLNRIRLLAQDLRPPALDAIGLNLTLKDLGHRFAKRTHISVKYEGQELPSLPDTINISLYRFLQEALTNVAKHASATQVQVKLSYENALIKLSIKDNGQGFDPRLQSQAAHHRRFSGLGLLGMHERLAQLRGQLVIDSHPGGGTYLEAQVPWPEELL
jgi:PAS domain S-box-containing protein